MNSKHDRDRMNELSEQIIAAAFEVSNQLGVGFLEKVYEKALVIELKLRSIGAVAQKPLNVSYKGHDVGEYFIDILVEDSIVVELKCSEGFADEHVANASTT